MLLNKDPVGNLVAVDVMPKFAVDVRARLEEIYGAILAVFVSARRCSRDVFSNGRAHRPDKGMNRTQHEDGGLLVPTCLAEDLPGVLLRMRVKGPRRVGAQFVVNPHAAEQMLGFQA